ncbi:MAG: hypothetical protein ACKPA7_30875 [Sphaerospermopsis kisseleviana]
MADLAVFNSPDVGDNKGEIITPIKRSRKKGGDLSNINKGQVAAVTSLNFDESSIQNVTIISEVYGADFLPQLYDRLRNEAAGQKEVFDQMQALEEALTVSRHLNVERAEKLGREKGSRQMELRQLLKLKTEADRWMDSNFEDMVIHYATVGLPYTQIVTTMVNHAAKLHINLGNFQITKDGKWEFPEYLFVHADKIEASKKRLAELGVELSKLKEMGIEV